MNKEAKQAKHTRHHHATVTLSKLDDKQNKKSNLFATTCSRMAQETKNYNNRPIPMKKNLSFFYPSLQQKTKMNTPSRLPIKIPATTTLTQSPLRTSPITLLKQNLQTLKKQNEQDMALIKQQNEEILRLQKTIEDNRNIKLKNQLAKAIKEEKDLSSRIIESLEVKSSLPSSYEKEICQLQMQLEAQEISYQTRLSQHRQMTKEMDTRLTQQHAFMQQVKLDHTNLIQHLNTVHQNKLANLQSAHEQDKIKLRKSKTTTPKPQHMNDLIEQALIEFEQQQHCYASTVIVQNSSPSLRSKVKTSMMRNQQWYSQKYMPCDALSWPSPQPISNLKSIC